MIPKKNTLKLLVFLSAILVIECHNKYSKDQNIKKPNLADNNKNTLPAEDFRPVSLKHLDRPFRMAKLNLLWSKAVHRLSEIKLKSLFGELKLHDKEEIAWKKLRGEGKDKDGLHEAELRAKLKSIMKMYGLLDQLDHVNDKKKVDPHKALNDASDKYVNKHLFKDKKLNKLWDKAQLSGFNAEELAALKEEFQHHEDKITQYYSLLYETKEGPHGQNAEDNSLDEALDKFNRIETLEEKEKDAQDHLQRVNSIRDINKEIKDGFDRLERLSSSGPASKDFLEPKVEGLWKIALKQNFSDADLQSLKAELRHYENRLLKLRNMQIEHAVNEEQYKEKRKIHGEKSEGHKLMEENIKKQARKVQKIHFDLESKIMKHSEL